MGFKVITLIDNNNSVVFENKVTILPLKEECIISKSVELFDDPCPCFIHRSAVMKRIFFEMDEFFSVTAGKNLNRISWEYIPEWIKYVLDVKVDIKELHIKEKK